MTVRLSLTVMTLTAFFASSSTCFAGDSDIFNWERNVLNVSQSTMDKGTYKDLELLLMGPNPESAPRESSPSAGLSVGKLHKYLGYTTVVLAAVTAVSSGTENAHWAAAYGTVGATALTLVTGNIAYGHRFNLQDGLFSQDNTHIILGTIGAIGCIAAVFMADSEGGGGHAGTGVFGGTAMALSIVTIRW